MDMIVDLAGVPQTTFIFIDFVTHSREGNLCNSNTVTL